MSRVKVEFTLTDQTGCYSCIISSIHVAFAAIPTASAGRVAAFPSASSGGWPRLDREWGKSIDDAGTGRVLWVRQAISGATFHIASRWTNVEAETCLEASRGSMFGLGD